MKIIKLGANSTVVKTDTLEVLYSYETPVGAWVYGRAPMKSSRFFSRTTAQHIAKWLDGRRADIVDHSAIEAIAQGENR